VSGAAAARGSRLGTLLRRPLRDVSFRVRLLAALVGSVGILGLSGLLVVGFQTQRQVAWVVQHRAEQTRRALAEVERLRRAELERLVLRLSSSIRIVAALDSVVNGGDRAEFAAQVQYELDLAELRQGLVRFDDAEGRAVLTLLDREPLADATAGQVPGTARRREDGTASGYRLVNDRLFLVLTHPLTLFDEPVGSLTIGFVVDDEVAARLAAIVDAEVCFAATRCLAASAGARSATLAGPMIAAARGEAPTYLTLDGRRLALTATQLPAADRVAAVIAVPLADVLAPFDRIRRVELLAAVAALLLAVLLGAVLSQQLTAPIRILLGATDRVRRGDYDFTVDVPHHDEFGTLAEGFNQMTGGLLLKERYRSVLDKVVSPDVAEALLKSDLRLGGETREVTTLFADVRGFSAMTEHHTPEQVIDMLNEWLELAAAAIAAEGGVVDKYVGDQVMAVWGAPVADPQHALHAVRAALLLRSVTAELDRTRRARGEDPLAIGIGVNTGPAVAGNSGSSTRLNYTVLGASVNAAMRLCSEAQPGEILIGEQTFERVRDAVDAAPLPSRLVKGFSTPIAPYRVEGLREPARGRSVGGAIGTALLVGTCLVTAAGSAPAQVFDQPTLDQRGVRYDSPGGLVQIVPSARIDVDLFVPQDEPAWHLEGTNPFVAGRVSLFTDVFIGRYLFFSSEVRVDRGQPARSGPLRLHLQQAFVRYTPVVGRAVSVQAGKFVSPFGGYPGRAHTKADPFIRPPLAYDYRTVMSATEFPAANDGVFTWKNRPAFRAAGLPIVWAVPYPIGATLSVGAGPVSATGGVTSSAVSADPADWDRWRLDAPGGLSAVGHVRWRLRPEVQVAASYANGAYMRPTVDAPRQAQETWGLDVTFERGRYAVRGEVLVNRWEVANVIEAPRDLSGYVEAQATLTAGWFVAIRTNAITFRDLATSSGARDRWDYDMQRHQIGTGYRLGRSSEVRAEYMINRTVGREDPRDDLLSLQWTWTF